MSTPTHDPERILRDIREWSPDEQLALAQTILHRVAQMREQSSARSQAARVPSSALRGLLANDRPAPTDEEVARWLDEARTEKYGG